MSAIFPPQQTRFPQLHDPERLRPYIEDFLEKVNLTDAILLYAPGQASITVGSLFESYIPNIIVFS